MEDFAVHLKTLLDIKDIVEVLKRHELGLRCAACDTIPVTSYITTVCDHNFCESCVTKKPFSLQCPRCKKKIKEDSLIVDAPYKIFSQCYKMFNTPEVSGSTIKSKIDNYTTVPEYTPQTNRKILTGVRKKSNDFLLQEECRKLFKNAGGKMEVVMNLLSLGANPNVLNKDGWTLMHEAVDYDNLEVLEALLEAGGNVNAYRPDDCSTCLHDAVIEDSLNPEIIRCLLRYGADIHATDNKGNNALERAKDYPHKLELLNSCRQIYDVEPKNRPTSISLLFGCNLKPTNQKQLALFCKTFNIKLAHQGKNVDKNVTHVVTDENPCQPQHKILLGILYGCYIVTMDWIEDSLREQYVLPPEKYEISGTAKYVSFNAPRKSRLNSFSLKPQLFAGGQFHLLDGMDQKLSPKEKEELVDLIIAGGGKIITRAKSFDFIGLKDQSVFHHAAKGGPLQFCSVVVLYKVKPALCYNMTEVKSLPIKWLYNAIQSYQISM